MTNINGTLEVDQGIITNNISIAVADNNTITTVSGDLNLTATAPGNVNITSETNEPTRITRNSGSNNIAVRSLALAVQSSGTPAAGFGNSLEYEIETAVGTTTRAGYVAVISEDVTPGSEDFRMIFGLMTAGAVADTKMSLNNTGDLTLDGGIRVLGSTSGSSIFEAPATGSTLSYVLPGAAGAASTVLTNDGSGNLTWALPGGGGSTFGNITVAVVDDNTISTTTGDLELTATGNNGVNITSGSDAPTLITRNSAVTNTTIRGLALNAQTSLTPAVGFGGTLEYQVEAQVGNTERAGFISVVSTDLTVGSEDFKMSFGLMEAGATYAEKAFLDSTGSLTLDNDLTVGGTNVNLAQNTVFAYSENNDRLNRPYVQSTTGNTSGWRIRAPNATTSAAASLSVSNTNDASNTKFLSIQATGSTTEPFRIASGQYIANVLSASGDSISIRDGATQYATINPAGPTVGTDLTTKTYVDGLIPTVVTYDYNATSTTGGANLNLVGSNATTDTVKLTNSNHITATYTSGTEVTLGSDATDANTVSTIVARDASGNFNAGTVSLAGQLISTRANDAGDGLGQIFLNGSGGNRIDWAAAGTGAPTFTTRSAGTKAVLYPALSGSQSDYALGIDAATLWSSVPVNSSSFKFKWYGGATEVCSLDGAGNLVLVSDLDVKGGDITNSTGALNITTGASNGAITLDPNGTGNVVCTFSNGGNLTNDRNYVFGAIRNATTQTTNGDIWELNTSAAQSATNPYFRGVSLDNSADTTRGPATLMRSYSGGAVAGSASRGRLIFEKARGTAASPTAVQSADVLGSIDVTGYSSTGWLNDTIPAVLGTTTFSATENWVSNTNLGTQFNLVLAPTATTISSGANLITVLAVNPQTSASRSDAFTWANGKTGTTQTMSLDVSGNLIVTGDVRINGNDIQGSGGTNAITLTSANTATTVRGDTINLANGANTATNLQLGSTFANFASAGTQYAAMNTTSTTFTNTGLNTFIRQGTSNSVQPALTLRYQRTDTTGPNDGDGVDFRLGLGGTSTNTNIARFDAVYKTSGLHQFGISVSTDSFSADSDSIYRGQADQTVIRATPAGTTGTAQDVLTITQSATTLKSDALTLQDAAGVALVGGKISYGRQYLEAYSTQDQTNPVANAENLMSFNNTGISNGVSVVTNGTTLSRITMSTAGVYNIQFSAQLNQTTGGAHNAFIWLKKNGTTVANTAGDTRIAGNGDRIMAAWNYIVSAAAGDYYELAWASSDTNVLLDYVAAAAPVPAIPSVILTVVPVGA